MQLCERSAHQLTVAGDIWIDRLPDHEGRGGHQPFADRHDQLVVDALWADDRGDLDRQCLDHRHPGGEQSGLREPTIRQLDRHLDTIELCSHDAGLFAGQELDHMRDAEASPLAVVRQGRCLGRHRSTGHDTQA